MINLRKAWTVCLHLFKIGVKNFKLVLNAFDNLIEVIRIFYVKLRLELLTSEIIHESDFNCFVVELDPFSPNVLPWDFSICQFIRKREFRIDVNRIKMNQDIFAKCSFGDRTVDYKLMVSWRKECRVHVNLTVAGRHIFQIIRLVHRLNIGKLIVLKFMVQDLIPSLDFAKYALFGVSSSLSLLCEFDDTSFNMITLLSI